MTWWPTQPADVRQRRCRQCEVGEYTDRDRCWSCGGPTEPGEVTGLARLREYPIVPPSRLETDGVASWEIHLTNPTLERHP